MQGIYAIVNTINGKRYVGSASDILRRWRRHRKDLRGQRHHAVKLQRAWNLYGESSFRFDVLAIVDDLDRLLVEEQRFIDEAGAYNSLALAGSPRGFRHTAEARAKISAAMSRPRGPATDTQRARWSEVRKGRRLPQEVYDRGAATRRGRPMSEAHRAKMRVVSVERERLKRERRAVQS